MALTKFNYNSFDVTPVASKAMGFNSDADGLTSISPTSMVLIKTLTASSSATLSFLNGSDDVVFDSTYPIYLFKFINIHPATDQVDFSWQTDTGTNTSYNQTITSTAFRAAHDEADTEIEAVSYRTADDQAQGTAFNLLGYDTGSDNDQNICGQLYLFSPSSSTYVKHFIAVMQNAVRDDVSQRHTSSGYVNTTTALTRVQFKFSSGNMDAGKIKLYGIKDS